MALPDVLRFKKRYMVPLWVVRIGFMVIIIGLYAWALQLSKTDSDDFKLTNASIAVIAVFMVALIICLLLDIVAIVLFARDALHPKTFLIFNAVQCTIWAAIIILDIVGVSRGGSAAGLILSFIVFMSFFALLAYSLLKYRRERKEGQNRGHYATTPNPGAAAFGHEQGEHMLPLHQVHEPSPGYPQRSASPYDSQAYTGAYGQHQAGVGGPQGNPFADPQQK